STGNLTNFTTIDPTGSTFTQPTSINASGEIVGWYHDAGNSFHGFIDIGGNITTFDAPGSNITFTEALSVNDSGQIVGVYNDADGHQHGFLRESNGTFITIDVPGSLGPLGSTMPASINNSGQIVGTYVDSSGVGHGFATDIDQALTTTPEAFHYTAGTGTADLGNTILNDVDPNLGGGPISFLSFGSASFEAQFFIPGLTAAIQGHVITITDSLGQATVTVGANGEESLSDPHNIFAALNGGKSIVLDVGYTIKDTLGVLAQDSQTITIAGPPTQPLIPLPEAFNYTEGAAVSSPVDLGNTINNDLDPNPGGGPISFLSFLSASFTAPTAYTLIAAGNTITITDSSSHTATITVDPSGEEHLSDPNNIFAPLNGGDSIVLNASSMIRDNLGLTALDSQTITIHGVTQAHPFPSDLSNLVLYLQNSQGSIEKVIFQNGAQLQFKTDSDISTWIHDHSTGANDILQGYTTLDAFTYHAGANNELD